MGAGRSLLFGLAAIDADIVGGVFGLAEQQQGRGGDGKGREGDEHRFENFHVWTSYDQDAKRAGRDAPAGVPFGADDYL